MPLDPRQQVVEIGRLMYQRFLTNAAGGNVSHRSGGLIYMSPRYAGSKNQWNLRPEQIVILDGQHNIVGGEGSLSRESAMHLAVYDAFPQVNSVIHAHPQYGNVFAATGRPIVPTNGYTEKFGEVPVVRPVPAHSPELAAEVVKALAQRQDELASHGLALILAWHGVVVVGRDLNDAFDTLERIEWSAHTILMAATLQGLAAPEFIVKAGSGDE